MKLLDTKLNGVFIIEFEVHEDKRGSFARTFDAAAFDAAKLVSRFDQQSMARNAVAGTIRGMHFQMPPYGETKLVRATRGALYDVVVDVRAGSATFGHWIGVQLEEQNNRELYIPEGFAHGYQTLCDDTEALYLIAGEYSPAAAKGIRFDDTLLAIAWPRDVTAISERDLAWPQLQSML